MPGFVSANQLIFGGKREQMRLRASSQYFYRRSQSAVGSPVVQLYRSKFRKDGTLELIPDGEHDLYAEIQSHAASTDINMILDRYFSGDPSALSRIQGVYADVSEAPSTIHEAMQLMDTARIDFAKLPPAVKDLFANDANQWLATLGSEEWYRKMGVNISAGTASDIADVDVGSVPVAPAASVATSVEASSTS